MVHSFLYTYLKGKFKILPQKTFYSRLTQMVRVESPWLWDLWRAETAKNKNTSTFLSVLGPNF